MKFGIEVVPFGIYSDPRNVVELAQVAEAAGWEGLWIWDHVLFPYGVGDPWISLAAVAAATKTIRLCTGISPMPRYRPHLLARMLTGLDILSQGRVIFGTGLGVASDFSPFGEPDDDKTRAEMTDEGLDLLEILLSGEQFSHTVKYYTAKNVRLEPTPLQKPRIPVWIGRLRCVELPIGMVGSSIRLAKTRKYSRPQRNSPYKPATSWNIVHLKNLLI